MCGALRRGKAGGVVYVTLRYSTACSGWHGAKILERSKNEH
nr:MAG TPA: Protein of unknown function (DUF2690) [Caudoviricetes sp.]